MDWVKQHLYKLDDDVWAGSLFLEMQPEWTSVVDYRYKVSKVYDFLVTGLQGQMSVASVSFDSSGTQRHTFVFVD